MWVLIAVLLVLVITAVAIMQVYDSYQSANAQMGAQAIQGQLAQSIGVLTNLYAQNPDFAGFNDTVALGIGAVPRSWTGAGPFVLPSGVGNVTFAAATVTNANDSFSMTVSGLTAEMCAALSVFSIAQMAIINVGGVRFENPTYISTSTRGARWAPTPAEAAANCAAPATVTYTVM